jgi:leucyl-tRNA synthetase
MMSAVNTSMRRAPLQKEYKTFLILLNPFASPHSPKSLGIGAFPGMITGQDWPAYDEEKTVEDTIAIACSNGKVRGTIFVGQTPPKRGCRHAKVLPTVILLPKINKIIKEIT